MSSSHVSKLTALVQQLLAELCTGSSLHVHEYSGRQLLEINDDEPNPKWSQQQLTVKGLAL